MLQAMHAAMIGSLEGFKATEEIVNAYKKYWNETLMGQNKNFPCPACFIAGTKEAALKALPAKEYTHYVMCQRCNAVYSYIEDDYSQPPGF
jgi:hypothetical protein